MFYMFGGDVLFESTGEAITVFGNRAEQTRPVTLFGEPAAAFDAGERIGYVPQDVIEAGRDMPITDREVVRMGRYPRRLVGQFTAEDRRAVEEAMEQVGIADLATRRVGRLSDGQRRRVFTARALACRADLLGLDEPSVGVDVESTEAFYELPHELNAAGLTVVLIEHDIDIVTTYATVVASLNRRLYFDGDPAEFVETDALAAACGRDQHVLQHDH
jgi:zinc transport system ATP-binding protein